ncbi:hypothetical protein [Actinophytocola glycyrrhizae]|uniref:DUF3558 domain-containing protein n=1 Tax=Actinophytocola glycyrrhizae TaxID=2044873 RepID=A0ABV9RRE2_9PSEU
MLLVVGGCSDHAAGGGDQSASSAGQVSVGGSSVPTSGATPSRRVFANPDKLTAQDALGDLTLLNPCSVIDPDTLPDTWTTVIDVPVAFNFCEISVTTREGAVIEARVGKPQLPWSTGKESPSSKLEAGISIAHGRPDIRGGCARDVVFADGLALGVNAVADTSMGNTDPCVVSDALADHVVSVVLDGRAESLTLPEGSLGGLDACTLVGPELLAAVPGLGADVEPMEFVAGHSCWWENPDTRATLDLEFEIGPLPVGDSGGALHGRYTATTQYADFGEFSLCEVGGEHVPFEYEDEMAIVESVTILVRLPAGQGKAACTAASTIADRLWQALPPL